LRFRRVIGSSLAKLDRLVDEVGMLAEHEILMIGETDIRMAMIKDVKHVDFAH
jgi:hypothetical protein